MALLDGRVAVVVNGGTGIGAHTARRLSAAGARVVVSADGSGITAAGRLASQIRRSGSEAVAIEADVAAWAGGRQLIDDAIEAYGAVHILVTCAACSVPAALSELGEHQWQSSLDACVKATVSCANPAAKRMVAQEQGGAIIAVCSPDAFRSDSPAHAAANAGIMGLTAAMAMNLQPNGITVNCVLADTMPQSPADVAPSLVTYLAGPRAADVTGRYFQASGPHVVVHNKPLQMEATNVLLRNTDDWDAADLDDVIRPMLSIGRPQSA